MPTYEYRCAECGHELEAFQSITAGPLRKCPNCGKHALKRLISSGAGVIFKGSGFYETDYNRSQSYQQAAKEEKEGTSSESKQEDGAKTDQKQESTASSTDSTSSSSENTQTGDTASKKTESEE